MKNGTGIKAWAIIATVGMGIFATLWSTGNSNLVGIERRIASLEVTCSKMNVELGKLKTSSEFIGKTLDKLEKRTWPQGSSKTYTPDFENGLPDYLNIAPDSTSLYLWSAPTDHRKSKTSSISADGTMTATSLTRAR